MKSSPNTLLRQSSITNYPNVQKQEKMVSYQNNHGICFMEERLFYLKAQTIIDELIQIMMFIKQLEKY